MCLWLHSLRSKNMLYRHQNGKNHVGLVVPDYHVSISTMYGHLFGKLLFTWLSLVMSMMVSFVLSFFPRDVLDEILKLIESVSEDFPSYSYNTNSEKEA